jgi:ABC-2 type transport system ATP-binding protein
VVIGRGRLLADTTVSDLIASQRSTTLEEAFMRLTGASVEYRAGGARS